MEQFPAMLELVLCKVPGLLRVERFESRNAACLNHNGPHQLNGVRETHYAKAAHVCKRLSAPL